MTKVTRYVLAELLKVFLFTLLGMTLLMLLVIIGQEAIRRGIGLETVAQLLPYAVPNALQFAVPGTILFASCSVFGRMAAGNELTALKSLGLSPLRMLAPAFVLAFLVSLVAVWLNDVAVSWGRLGMKRVVLQSIEQIAYGMLRAERSYADSCFSINVREVRDRKLIQPMITFDRGDGSRPLRLTAAEAELQLDREQAILSILMTSGEIRGEQGSISFPGTIAREIPLTEFDESHGTDESPSNIALRFLADETARQTDKIATMRCDLAVDAAYELLSGDLAELTSNECRNRQQKLTDAKYRLHRLHTEPWRRWANGFSCLFFVAVGAPLSIRLRNSDLWTTFAAVFLPILIVYYPLLAFGVDRAKSGDLPPYTVWAGNIVLGIAGIWLTRDALRH